VSRVLNVGFDPADVFTATEAPLLQTLPQTNNLKLD